MFTKVSLSGTAAPLITSVRSTGGRVVGQTSGAVGFVFSVESSPTTNNNTFNLVNVSGTFQKGETVIASDSAESDKLIENSNNVDLNCDSTGNNSSCGTANAVINFTGNSNDIDLDIGQTSSANTADVDIVGQSGSDSNVVAATVDGNSAILTITINGDTNNYLIDIDGNGDVNGHTLIHSHTGGTADVDIVQSGINDQYINLTTSGDNHDIDIQQTD